MPDVVMPRLSGSMEEGTIVKWLKALGDGAVRGEGLVEVETDKANMTCEADVSGVLEVVAEEGATLPTGEPIARRLAEELGVDLAAIAGSGPGGRVVKADVEAAAQNGAVVAAEKPALAAVPEQPPAPAAAVASPSAGSAGSAGEGETTVVELTRTQQVIARRTAESKATPSPSPPTTASSTAPRPPNSRDRSHSPSRCCAS